MNMENKKMTTGKFIIYSIINVFIFPAAILFLSGNWCWPEGWIFGLWCDAMVLSSLFYLYRNDPALLAAELERVTKKLWAV